MTLTVNIYTHPKQTALSHLNNIYTECLKGYIWFCVFAESKPELGVKAGTLIPNTENLICFWDIGVMKNKQEWFMYHNSAENQKHLKDNHYTNSL